MIIVAIGIVVIAALVLSIFIFYDTERSKVIEAEQDARLQENQKIREEILVSQLGNNITITNEGPEKVTITGLLVVCDDEVTRITRSCAQDSNGVIMCGGNIVGDYMVGGQTIAASIEEMERDDC